MSGHRSRRNAWRARHGWPRCCAGRAAPARALRYAAVFVLVAGAGLDQTKYYFSSSEQKRDDAFKLGATDFALTTHPQTFTKLQRHFHFILNTVSAPIDYNAYLNLLQTDGTMILVGVPDRPSPLSAFPLIFNRRRIAGSVVGGIRETQEMLNFCADHQIESGIETISIHHVDEAYERVLKGDVRFRFVIDVASLN
mgnify:CR=1 FL=1